MEKYDISRLTKGEFKKIGTIMRTQAGKPFVLMGFNKEDEDFFKEVGFGTISIKATDGDEYLQALDDLTAFSHTLMIQKIEE